MLANTKRESMLHLPWGVQITCFVFVVLMYFLGLYLCGFDMQITGDFQAVKKALLSVSGCLQDNPKVDAANSGATKISGGLIHGTGMPAQVDPIPHRGFVSGFNAADYHSRNYSSTPGPENVGSGHRMLMEEEVVFKLLCQVDKVGSLIGKGGSIIRILQSETGASIKIADCAPDSDERVVIISAQEVLELNCVCIYILLVLTGNINFLLLVFIHVWFLTL